MTSHFNFKITQESIDKLSELLKWHERVKGEMIDTLAVHGNAYTKIIDNGLEITGVWVDESVAYGTLNKSNKQHKPKHKVPFWVQDWRSKK